MRIQSKSKKAINKELYLLCKEHHESVPFDKIACIMQKHNRVLLQEDHTPFAGVLCGNLGRTTFPVGYSETSAVPTKMYPAYDNTMFVLSWYALNPRKYEIVCYLSSVDRN